MKPLGLQLPEHSGHGLDRPDDAAENEIGVEYAQCDLRGVLLCVADCGDDEADGGAADPLQHGQKEHQEQGTLIGNLESEIKKAIIKLGSTKKMSSFIWQTVKLQGNYCQ